MEVARLRRRFSFVLDRALSFRTRHYLCRHGVALAGTRQLRSQDPVSVQVHFTEKAGFEGQEGANGFGCGIGIRGGGGGLDTGTESGAAMGT